MSMSKLSFSVGILCGGQATRMGGVDKGLQKAQMSTSQSAPMIELLVSCLSPYSKEILISANRNLDIYRNYSQWVYPDIVSGSLGPMAGLHTLLNQCSNDYLLTSPCDTPFLTRVYADRMSKAFDEQQPDAILIASIEGKLEPLHLLIPTSFKNELEQQLSQGKLSVNRWLREQTHVAVDFSDISEQFRNINTLDQLNREA